MNYHAKPGYLVAIPGTGRFMGVQFLPDRPDGEAQWSAHQEPYPVPEKSAHALHFQIECKRGNIWPADKETAAACGVPFVPLNFVAGDASTPAEWVPAKSTPQANRKAAE